MGRSLHRMTQKALNNENSWSLVSTNVKGVANKEFYSRKMK